MIVTSRLSIAIVRYLDLRNQSVPLRWTPLSEIADNVHGPEDLAFNHAVDVAKCRGWIIVEDKSPWRHAAQTKAGCSLLREASATPTGAGRVLPAVRAAPTAGSLSNTETEMTNCQLGQGVGRNATRRDFGESINRPHGYIRSQATPFRPWPTSARARRRSRAYDLRGAPLNSRLV